MEMWRSTADWITASMVVRHPLDPGPIYSINGLWLGYCARCEEEISCARLDSLEW